jgi:hypothetical protein
MPLVARSCRRAFANRLETPGKMGSMDEVQIGSLGATMTCRAPTDCRTARLNSST